MKAFFITEPGKTAIGEMPCPDMGREDVKLQVRVVGYCGSDLNTYRGKNPMVSYPRIPGHEIAGTVLETGADVPDSVRVGMNVTLSPYTNCGVCPACRRQRPNACRDNQTLGVQRDGALTEQIVAPWQKLYLSDALSIEELALVEPLTVGFHAVDRGRVAATDVVAVLGCGAIGLGAIAGAAFRDATVVAVDIDDGKLAIARKAGATHTVNSAGADSLHERLAELTDGNGPDVVIEAIGLPMTYRAAVEEVAYTGRVVYIGYAKEPVAYETKLFVQKELDVMGSRNALGDFASVIQMLEKGAFPVDDVVTRTVPFEQAGEALREWDADPGAVTKILVRVS